MKILIVNNFYYNRGGDCTYMLSLKKMLENNGHEVVIFSMHHPQNFESEYSKYFVSYINYADMVKNVNLLSGLKVMFRSIYSFEAKKKLADLIENEKPDIAHLHNIRHHITTSILPLLKKNGIPIVWTLHDYQLICPNISFLNKGRICERCRKRKYYWPVFVKCKKNSVLASTMAAVEHTFQLLMRMYDRVDKYICPSRFLKNKFVEYEFQKQKLLLLNHFMDIDINPDESMQGEYIIYVGRLSVEKGLYTLINAVSQINSCRLIIVGDGPAKEELMSYASRNSGIGNISFQGHRSRQEVIDLIRRSKYMVVPSEWYEVAGQVILEAYSCGKPVIGARIGGITEFINESETGLTFEPGNVEDLRIKIKAFEKNNNEVVRMGRNGLKYVKNELNAERHYEKLMEIYEKALHREN